jgi:hypothetical protein
MQQLFFRCHKFFTGNYVTEGMRLLLTEAFNRLEGKSQSSSGAFLLSQAKPIMKEFHAPGPLGTVHVASFSRRNTKTPFGF